MENLDYCFYSKVLNKPFDTLNELVEAENEYNKAHEKELKAKQEMIKLAHKLESAYSEYKQYVKEATETMQGMWEKFTAIKETFINTYGELETEVHNGELKVII